MTEEPRRQQEEYERNFSPDDNYRQEPRKLRPVTHEQVRTSASSP